MDVVLAVEKWNVSIGIIHITIDYTLLPQGVSEDGWRIEDSSWKVWKRRMIARMLSLRLG